MIDTVCIVARVILSEHSILDELASMKLKCVLVGRSSSQCVCVCVHTCLFVRRDLLWGIGSFPTSAVGKLKTQENQWCSSIPNVSRLETQKELMFQFLSKGQKRLVSWLKAVRQEEFPLTYWIICLFVLFGPSPDWMGPTHIREGNLLFLAYLFKC